MGSDDTQLCVDSPDVDYASVIAAAAALASEAHTIRDYLMRELPRLWIARYASSCRHDPHVFAIDAWGFDYLFDFTTERVNCGKLCAEGAPEDRVVAVHGISRGGRRRRADGVMKRQPLGPIAFVEPILRNNYDRGHFIAHSIGADLHINIFPQLAGVNRGLGDVGRTYRSMERYCAARTGTYCFSRPLYSGLSAHPRAIEFGVLRDDDSLWVNLFPNCGTADEMAEIERLLAAKLSRG